MNSFKTELFKVTFDDLTGKPCVTITHIKSEEYVESFTFAQLAADVDAKLQTDQIDADEATDTVDIKTPTEFAAKRLEKNLNNKWSGYTFVRKGTVVAVPNVRFVIRYIEKQPEFEAIRIIRKSAAFFIMGLHV